MDFSKKQDQLNLQEQKVIEETEKIEHAEDRIEKEEKEILSSEKHILSFLKSHPFMSFFVDAGLTKRELNFFRLVVVNKIAKHKLIFGLLLCLALVLIWRGLWNFADSVPILSYWLVSLLIGIFIIWVLRRYSNLP